MVRYVEPGHEHHIADTSYGRNLYLDLMKRTLTNTIYGSVVNGQYNEQTRYNGRDWPSEAHTMIGIKRLDNLQCCVEDVLKRNVPGDFIETGVWKGGATIFMRAILKAYGVTDRLVWVADSFAGLPLPSPDAYPQDAGSDLYSFRQLQVSLPDVQANFAAYGLLDEQVRFLKGWFRDTLPIAPIEHLAVLRLDGDMYESTMDALTSLYGKVSIGGYIIVDDYLSIPACEQAVRDFRAERGITDNIREIDWTGVYWQRSE